MKETMARYCAAVIGIVALVSLVPPTLEGVAEHGSVAASLWALLRYFTILTNLAVGVGFSVLAWRGREQFSPSLVGALALSIALVGFVANAILGSYPYKTVLDAVCDHSHHILMPLVVPLWWLIFAPHGRLRWSAPFDWALYPLAYGLYILIRVGFEARHAAAHYPYFFLDVAKLGWGRVVLNMTAIGAAFVLVGLAMVWLDRRLGPKEP